jgi:hypothetical protein
MPIALLLLVTEWAADAAKKGGTAGNLSRPLWMGAFLLRQMMNDEA